MSTSTVFWIIVGAFLLGGLGAFVAVVAIAAGVLNNRRRNGR